MFDQSCELQLDDGDLITENNRFKEEITTFINDIKSIRDKTASPSPSSQRKQSSVSDITWKAEYAVLLERLEDILDDTMGDINLAKKKFRDLDISHFESFSSYAYTTDPTLISSKKNVCERAKTLRAKRKTVMACPNCKIPLVSIDQQLTCPQCGYTTCGKSGDGSGRSSTDNNKHTIKQLDAVMGKKKPPANILKIREYISIWLTNMKFIHDWLIDNNKLEWWMDHYYGLTKMHINESFFEQEFDRTPNNAWDYDVFKLFTDELYLLLEKAKRISKLPCSNMSALPKDEIVSIFQDHYNATGTLPSNDEIYSCVEIDEDTGDESEVDYEIGLYVEQLKLIYDSSSDSVKTQLEQMYGKSLTLAGLMFNFNDVYDQSNNVPRKYNYQQEYMYIKHCTFNVPYANIDQQDQVSIIDIILRFNAYYKDEMFRTKGKHCNAPLFCCTLVCVIQYLPYFGKYSYVEQCLPIKDKNTLANIKRNFFKFMCANSELIESFKNNDSDKSNDDERRCNEYSETSGTDVLRDENDGKKRTNGNTNANNRGRCNAKGNVKNNIDKTISDERLDRMIDDVLDGECEMDDEWVEKQNVVVVESDDDDEREEQYGRRRRKNVFDDDDEGDDEGDDDDCDDERENDERDSINFFDEIIF